MNLQQGLIWFDKSPLTSFEEKIRAAVAAYESRFRRQPTVCYVHPDDLPPEVAAHDNLRVLTAPTVLRHHFFVGLAGRAG